ncbi:RHS repeat-associated core domain-containing protein [Paenibacillus dendritiformis]|uniref:RHS repeat-associated core domain-containing protein n=1 Tax=Paenibacillus dendritiformis TaxID=130049 RepID=UPI001B2FE4CB|nr:RHS repeat-associated core domain-containing protein [Paenibacillus dendritiformis]
MLFERSGSGTTSYAYDAFNRTAQVEKPDGSYVRHDYDPEGLRSGICENGVTSRFVFDGWNMLNELDEEWNAKASYVRGHELLAQVDGLGDAYYYLNNQHGDVVHITNRLGGIVNSYVYDAFGHTLSATEGIPNRFRYAGEQFDPVTQQYYLRARFYNPVIARFTQEDEYRGDGLNLYAYVGNNPIKYVDPSGYSCEEKGNVYGKGDKKEGPYEETKNPVFTISKEMYPNHAGMLENAQNNGHSLENLQRGAGTRAAKKNRYEAQKQIRKEQGPPPKGYDYDEFPYASTKQGGAGSHVEPVPSAENQAAGRDLGQFYRKHGLKENDYFDVKIID